MRSTIAKLAACSVLCVASLAAPSRPGDFKVIGPGGGGAQFHPAVSPLDSNIVLVACDMTGNYISKDGGSSWRMFNLRGGSRYFAFDPKDKNVMYAGGNALWRSADQGTTWSMVYPNPAKITGIQMSSDHGDESYVSDGDEIGRFTAFRVHPSNGKIFYGAGVKQGKFALWQSLDQGTSWKRLRDLDEPAMYISAEGLVDTGRLVVGGAHGVLIAEGGEWKSLAAPEGATFLGLAEGRSGAGNRIVYATSAKGIFTSLDGAPWQLTKEGASFSAIAANSRSQDAYVAYESRENRRAFGMMKTIDGGKTWNQLWEEPVPEGKQSTIRDAWMSERFGSTWGGVTLTMTVAFQDANLVYVTDLGRTIRSRDGGKTWDAVYSAKADAGWRSTGLDVTTAYGYHIDPFDAKRHFITYTDIGMFRSEDGGSSWVSSTAGVPRPWVNTTYWVVFDPTVKGRMWGVMSGTHDLPRPKMFRRTSIERYRGGVCRSDDGGKTWQATSEGMPQTAATHILLDTKSPQDARVLYVAAFGRGVYKSTDGGKSWAAKNEGLPNEPFAWRLSHASDGALYLVLARRSENGSIGDDRDGFLYRSTDGAEHWTRVALPDGVNGPNGLTVDSKDSKRLYLSAWARAKGMHGEGGGIYLSSDGGATWRSVLDRDQHVYDVTADPRDANRLYASGFESSAWMSPDRGEHWTRIPGFNFKWGHRVIPDPANKDSVYITTFGGSVWHGNVRGNAGAVLDIATPEVMPK